ncbi:MAG: hypothetical protein KAH23_01325 [Kiritimatiellae bacterium]|nr:hypothetical protein [Kiritimatiellia bacterium]
MKNMKGEEEERREQEEKEARLFLTMLARRRMKGHEGGEVLQKERRMVIE